MKPQRAITNLNDLDDYWKISYLLPIIQRKIFIKETTSNKQHLIQNNQ